MLSSWLASSPIRRRFVADSSRMLGVRYRCQSAGSILSSALRRLIDVEPPSRS
jgi:hypothetical protein